MVYETEKEMENVMGKLIENSFILEKEDDVLQFEKKISGLIKRFQNS
jgi:hypothetical protein